MYLLLSIFVSVLSFFLFKKTGADMHPRGLNMLSWIFYVKFICCSLLGSVFIVHGLDNHYIISTIVNNSDHIRFCGWGLVLYTMIIFPLGVLCMKPFFKRRYLCLAVYSQATFARYYYPLLYFNTFLSIIACLYVLYVSGYVGLINILLNMASVQDRITYGRNFMGNEYIRNILAQQWIILLSLIWYIKSKISNKIIDTIWFSITLLFAVIMSTQSYAKAPIIMLFISFLMLRIYLFGRLSIGNFAMAMILSIIGILIMYIKVTGSDISMIFSAYNTGILGRIFFSEVAGLFKTLEFFPSIHEFIGFHSISHLLTDLLGVEYIDRSARIVMTQFNPRGVAEGTAGVMNSLFVAEAWANWGAFGAVLAPLIAGMITGIIYYVTVGNKNVIFGAVYAYLATIIPITGGFNDFIYPVGIFTPFCCIFFIIKLKVKKHELKTFKNNSTS